MSTWVLLRGLTREARHWGDFPARLQAALPAARVMTLDLPGNGALAGERSPAHITDMVESCRAQLRARGVAMPVYILAMSLGAMVAVAWAEHYPQEVLGAVLINTSLRPFSPEHWRLRPRHALSLLQLAMTGAAARPWEDAILRMTSAHAQQRSAVLDQWIAWREQAPVSRLNALRQLWAAMRYCAPRLAPAPPMLILNGGADDLVDPRCSLRLAAAWQVPLAIHTHAGHDLPLDDGDWVAAQVRDWIATQPLSAA